MDTKLMMLALMAFVLIHITEAIKCSHCGKDCGHGGDYTKKTDAEKMIKECDSTSTCYKLVNGKDITRGCTKEKGGAVKETCGVDSDTKEGEEIVNGGGYLHCCTPTSATDDDCNAGTTPRSGLPVILVTMATVYAAVKVF